jgi:hypothetical protein
MQSKKKCSLQGVRANKTAVTSGSLIEATIEKYVSIVKTYEIQIVTSAGPAWIIPIIADMMCNFCKESIIECLFVCRLILSL